MRPGRVDALVQDAGRQQREIGGAEHVGRREDRAEAVAGLRILSATKPVGKGRAGAIAASPWPSPSPEESQKGPGQDGTTNPGVSEHAEEAGRHYSAAKLANLIEAANRVCAEGGPAKVLHW